MVHPINRTFSEDHELQVELSHNCTIGSFSSTAFQRNSSLMHCICQEQGWQDGRAQLLTCVHLSRRCV